MEPEPGGVLMFGIPEYRLPKEVVRREIKKIENLGVPIHLNSTIGEGITVDDLFARGFDAIFMGTARRECPGGCQSPASTITACARQSASCAGSASMKTA